MRRIGPLIAQARATIEAQAEHIQKQALEYISLFDQCSEAQDRVKELEAKCALLAQSLEQEKTRSAALEAGLTDGVTDDMAVLQSRIEELEAQLRERGEPVAWETEQKGFTKNAAVAKWWRDAGLSVIEYYAHPPAAAASEDKRDAERYRYLRNIKRQECLEMDGPEAGVWIDSEDENGTLQLLTEADADAAIDAAIAAQKERGE
jgi:chromosome segregation ATPase